jgi:hypothetical protein
MASDDGSQSEGEAPGQSVDIGEILDNDPMAKGLLDKVELLIFGLGIASSILTLLAGNLSITAGWIVGWLVGQSSVAMSRRLTRRLIVSKSGSTASAILLLLKTFVLLIGIWVTLQWTKGNVIAFACGYGMTLTGLVLGSMLCAPRPSMGETSEADESTLDKDQKRG